MSSAPLPSPPSRDFLKWAIEKPHEVEAYLRRIVLLSRLEIVVRSANGTTRIPVEFSRENAVAILPPGASSAGDGGGGGGGTGGDVFGPSSSTPDNLPTFGNESGKLLKDSGVSIEDVDPRGLHSLWIPAAVMQPSVTGGCAPLSTVELEAIIDGGDAGDEFPDVIDAGDAGDEFTEIIDGNPTI